MSYCLTEKNRNRMVTTVPMPKHNVIFQAQRQVTWASGLVVMTSRLQRGDRLFNSGLAHLLLFFPFQKNNTFI